MEISSASYNCFPHLGMEESNDIFGDEYYQYEMDSLMGMGYPVVPADEIELASSLSGSGDSYSSYTCLNSKRSSLESPDQSVAPRPRPTKQLKTSNSSWVAGQLMPPKLPNAANSNNSRIISFGNNTNVSSSLPHEFDNLPVDKRNPKIEIGTELYNQNLDFSSLLEYDTPTTKPTTTVTRNSAQTQDHVMAERKRREKLSQMFIALSAILPGLKKMDKASVLGHAIKYVENLQVRVKSLEDQVAKKTVESAVYVNRSLLSTDDATTGTSSSQGNYDQSLPEIEARVSGKDVLIRIHCEKPVTCVSMVLGQLQKLHLTVQSSSFLPFGTTTIHITIVARMDEEHCITAKELVKSLRQSLIRSSDSE
ncbi:hypothetical protein L6164_027967 [Bauhinia variegata]|uniref:Uncharacterized protein n=1 Tax=Bauhinia variegata TaxID=167791 RepID=A0ACB9LVK0_BAUVA|nr:hypothetical protein L6164_027967 [Bauhinia variegata]